MLSLNPMDDVKSSPNVSDVKSNLWFNERPAGEVQRHEEMSLISKIYKLRFWTMWLSDFSIFISLRTAFGSKWSLFINRSIPDATFRRCTLPSIFTCNGRFSMNLSLILIIFWGCHVPFEHPFNSDLLRHSPALSSILISFLFYFAKSISDHLSLAFRISSILTVLRPFRGYCLRLRCVP